MSEKDKKISYNGSWKWNIPATDSVSTENKAFPYF